MNIKILFSSIISVSILSLGHALGISILILIGLLSFLVILIKSPEPLFLPIMLFFLPWSQVLKFNAGEFSFYTISILIFFLVLFIRKELTKKAIININNLILVSIFTSYTLAIKISLEHELSLSYLMFLIMLILIPTYLQQYSREISFETSIYYFALGIITSGFISKQLMEYPHMLQFIDIYIWEKMGLTRLSGFYGDANFYSAHILVAICGLLIIILNKKMKEILINFTLIILLVYLGILSVSKMFLFVLIIIFGIWITLLFIQRGKISAKIAVISCLVFGIVFVISTGLFEEQIQMYLIRFSMVSDITSLTTGRSDILISYLTYFEENVLYLFFGQGLSEVYAGVNMAAHNTLLQVLYQIGLIGFIFIIIWVYQLFQLYDVDEKVPNATKLISYCFTTLFSIACFVPWLSLDILFFDEFFYISALFVIGHSYFFKGKQLISLN